MILDTCALLWLAGNERNHLTGKILNKIDSAPVVSIVSITGFEIGKKYQSGKLHLSMPTADWVNLAVEFHQLEIIPLALKICLKASQLPQIHKDPCDRFIIAAALLRGMPVVTADRRFPDYGVDVLY